MKLPRVSVFAFLLVWCHLPAAAECTWPTLPDEDAAVSIPAQPWPLEPGPRSVEVFIRYPGGKLSNVGPETGVMLSLHNWGGVEFVGTANPVALANRLNVVAVGVNYLQSGPYATDNPDSIKPYDFGYFQALDALRALWFVYDGLVKREMSFASGRIYACGGSGGGNVTLMCNKLAPRTFACIVDMSGMARLTDAIAFEPRTDSLVAANYSNDPTNPRYLTPDAQQLRFVGHPRHVRLMKTWGNTCKIVVIHGSTDPTCPAADAREMVDNMTRSGLDVDAHFITRADIDGTVVKNTGHSVGDRTQMVFKFAERYLLPEGPERRTRREPNDFQLRDRQVRYPTAQGAYVISYENGYPIGSFEKEPPRSDTAPAAATKDE